MPNAILKGKLLPNTVEMLSTIQEQAMTMVSNTHEPAVTMFSSIHEPAVTMLSTLHEPPIRHFPLPPAHSGSAFNPISHYDGTMLRATVCNPVPILWQSLVIPSPVQSHLGAALATFCSHCKQSNHLPHSHCRAVQFSVTDLN